VPATFFLLIAYTDYSSLDIMAYRDPYRDPYATQYAQQSGQQQYDKELPQFNPYVGYQTYDQGGNRSYNDVQYTDEPAPHNPRYDALGASQPTLVASNDVVADPQPATEPVGDYDFGAPGRPKQEKSVWFYSVINIVGLKYCCLGKERRRR